MQPVIDILLAVLMLLAVSLQRTYHAIPPKELKRRARSGDDIAAGLYRAVGYGHSLGTILWFLVILSSAAFFVSVSISTPIWFALLASALMAYVGFVWLPGRRVSAIGQRFAHVLAPVFAWLLNYLHPIIDKSYAFINRHLPVTFHTGLYEKEDLLDLLEHQQVQADNRITQAELDIAYHALTVGDKLVSDVMIPRRVVKMIRADDTVGPILMTEVHESGHSRYPVYDGKQDNIVGTIYLHDLLKAKAGGKVRDVMRPADVSYVHEDESLISALQAILKTRRHLFIVVNSFEEYVGVITIEDVLEQIIGQPIVDEFDQYEDMRAVAAKLAKDDHKAHIAAEPPIVDIIKEVE